jgi:integrase
LPASSRLHSVDRSDLIWLPEHITAFMKVASIELQRALILALHAGQRQGDLLRLTWGNYVGAFISLRQGKSARDGKPGRKVEIPCTRVLRKMLDGLDRNGAVIISTKIGRPWKPRYLKAQWEAASKDAGITDLHFHDLRGTAVTRRSRMHDAADRRHHRPFLQDGNESPRQVPRPHSCSRRRGCHRV